MNVMKNVNNTEPLYGDFILAAIVKPSECLCFTVGDFVLAPIDSLFALVLVNLHLLPNRGDAVSNIVITKPPESLYLQSNVPVSSSDHLLI